MSKRLTIAVDGPGSAGKGTVARGVARQLDYQYIDTGAMYRSVALRALQEGLDLDDAPTVSALAARLEFQFVFQGDVLRIVVDGEDLTQAIRADHIGMGASKVSKHPSVRTALLALQRQLGATGGVVMDGRDIGTVVLPDAELKIYMDASLEVRALRRYDELIRQGASIRFDQVREALEQRDRQDMERDVAPLVKAADAHLLDTSEMSIKSSIATVVALAHERGA